MSRWVWLILIICISVVGCNGGSKGKGKYSGKDLRALADTNYINVGILIMDGVLNTELFAPYDVFQHTMQFEGIKPMRVFTLAKEIEPVRTSEGARVIPDFSYLKEVPRIDVLVLPSAEQYRIEELLEDKELLSSIREIIDKAEYVTSHGSSAMLLAEMGELDGLACTGHPDELENMQELYPEIDVKHGAWWVHHKKFITSSGGGRAYQASLYLSRLLYGNKLAEELARRLRVEWTPRRFPHQVEGRDF